MSSKDYFYSCSFYHSGSEHSIMNVSLSEYRKWLYSVLSCLGIDIDPLHGDSSYVYLNLIARDHLFGFRFWRVKR